MNQETLKLIESLATKLGVTSEHLWGVLLKQERIDAMFALSGIIIFLFVILGLLLIAFLNWNSKNLDEQKISLLAVGLFFSIGLFIYSSYSFVQPFFNPEYEALKKLIEIAR